MRLVFLGAPGAGKGTQAARLAAEASVPHISTGDILRRAIQLATPTGIEAQEYVERGDLVPFDIILRLVHDRLGDKDCAKGWILDGFPRNLSQADAFATLLGELSSDVDHIVYFAIDDGIVVERLAGRRTCRKCGAACHIKFSPPKTEGVCDNCGGELYQRPDDSEASIRNRLEVYGNETNPLVEHYRNAGKLVEIDASASVDEVYRRVREAIA